MQRLDGRRFGGILIAAVLALLLGGVGSTSMAGAAVTRYPLQGGGSAITTGPDGALWIATTGSIIRMTTKGTYTRYSDPASSDPRSITVGPDGALWFTNANVNSIGRITTAGAISHFTATGLVAPTDITPGPDGALWFADSGSVGRITTAGTITLFTDSTITNTNGIVAGPDGALWFTVTNRSIGRITTSGTVTNYPDTLGDYPLGITVGPDGALWFTNQGVSALGRITTDGTITRVNGSNIDNPTHLVVGPDGAFWFPLFSSQSVGRMTTSGVDTTYRTSKTDGPNDVAAGPDGALWFATTGNSIGRITPPVPDAPTITRVAPRHTVGKTGALTVAFTAAADNGFGITSYATTCKGRNGGVTRTVVRHGASAAAITVDRLTTGRTYSCTVTATNSVGTGVTSADAFHVIVGSPGAPSGITLRRGATHDDINVRFHAPANNGTKITGYRATCTSDHGKLRTGSNATSPVLVRKLTRGRTYHCTVRAVNKRGVGPASARSKPING